MSAIAESAVHSGEVDTFVRPKSPSENSVGGGGSDAESAVTEGADEEEANSDANYSGTEGPDSRQASIDMDAGTVSDFAQLRSELHRDQRSASKK